MRSIALAAGGKYGGRQPDGGLKTLQAFVDAHWQHPFTTCGGAERVCCAWANVCGIPRVARLPQASNALILGTYGQGLRLKTSSPKTRRREVLQNHLGMSCGTTSSRRNLHRPRHHHRLAAESCRQHCAQRYHALCPLAATAEVVGGSIVFMRWEAMDIGVPFSDAEAAILSRLVEVYIGLHMCASIRATTERILLHCSLTFALGTMLHGGG